MADHNVVPENPMRGINGRPSGQPCPRKTHRKPVANGQGFGRSHDNLRELRRRSPGDRTPGFSAGHQMENRYKLLQNIKVLDGIYPTGIIRRRLGMKRSLTALFCSYLLTGVALADQGVIDKTESSYRARSGSHCSWDKTWR